MYQNKGGFMGVMSTRYYRQLVRHFTMKIRHLLLSFAYALKKRYFSARDDGDHEHRQILKKESKVYPLFDPSATISLPYAFMTASFVCWLSEK